MPRGGAGRGHLEGPAGGEADGPDREQSAEAAVGERGSAVQGGATEGGRREVSNNTQVETRVAQNNGLSIRLFLGFFFKHILLK